MSLIKQKIPLKETGRFSSLFLDYIAGHKELAPFYTFSPDMNGLAAATDAVARRSYNRKLLADVLDSQYKEAGITSGVIALLKEDNTYTVCTGHQLCLFTGPLYFIFKIVTTINLARALKKKFPERNFVPVYWMASEDHDFEEVRTVHLFGRSLSWEHESGGPVGRLSTSGLEPLLAELKQVMGDSQEAKELYRIFTNAYTKKNLAEATRSLVHELFGDEGLLVLDPDDASLKKEFMPLMMDDIRNRTNYSLVRESAAKLEAAGYPVQVNPREINVFRITDDQRTRIEEASTENLALSAEQLSPNVVLRPLFQQSILPNIAYVGGPGEIAYWLEYKKMFDHHKIEFPVLMPRNFAMLTDEKTLAQVGRIGISFMDLFSDPDALTRSVIEKKSASDLSVKAEENELVSVYEKISGKAALADPTLKGAAEAELQKALSGIRNIETKMIRAEKQRQETTVNQLRKLREKFLPEGQLQERHENFIPFYLKNKDLIRILLEEFDILDREMLVIEL